MGSLAGGDNHEDFLEHVIRRKRCQGGKEDVTAPRIVNVTATVCFEWKNSTDCAHLTLSDFRRIAVPASTIVGFSGGDDNKATKLRPRRVARHPQRWVAHLAALELVASPSSSRTSAVVVCRIRSQRPSCWGAGGACSRAISRRMSWSICRGTATSAIWNMT